MKLNPAQDAAVKTSSGPLLVLAGAGTGKTRVVATRIVRLIRQGTRPERILAVTFTNKAAREMQQRVRKLLGKGRKTKPEVSTFHSLSVRILRRHIHHLGYPGQFAIYDRPDQQGVARSVLREIKAPDTSLRPADLLGLIGHWKTHSISPRQAVRVAQTDKEHLAAIAYGRYQKALKAAGAVDFDDLLLCTEELFRRFPDVRRQEADRFDHLLVDEYQDTNGSQYRIVKALAEGHRNLCVVGDDDQSIYAWRGAEVAHILRFRHDWPDAKIVCLEMNYRSTREILNWANSLIAFNKQRHHKVLRTNLLGESPRILQFEQEEAEARTVVDEIAGRLKSTPRQPRHFAILFRTNEQPRAFEMELRRAKVPYVLVGGQSFYDRKEVRDILAYLKLLVNPRDDAALLRIINTPARGIGQTTVTRLMEEAAAESRPVWDVAAEALRSGRIGSSVAAALGAFRSLMERFGGLLDKRSLPEVVSGLIGEIGYQEELARLYSNPEERQARWASVEEVLNAASGFVRRTDQPTMAGFLQELALVGNDNDPEKESKLKRNAVALMTLHAAKGLEFREVYMVGMEEGFLPHRRSVEADGAAIDEERRLCYVGFTRAQRRLTLTLALSRIKRGKPRPTIPSRFLYEATGQADNPHYLAAKHQQPPRRRPSASRSPTPQAGTRKPGKTPRL